MLNSFNPLDPMNQSMYLESYIPASIDEAIKYYADLGYTSEEPPKLAPQPVKDSWYYHNDGTDDGKISTFEKIKAFAKGGTYNIVKGLFCNEKGFSIGRTIATALSAAAIGLTGPIGVAIAGGVGLVAGVKKFLDSCALSNNATTDFEARKAYEGLGESATMSGLSLFGGFKSLKAIRLNSKFIKNNPALNLQKADKLMRWNLSKLFGSSTTP